MIQVVCIAKGTQRENVNEVGDIVSIHEADVDLTGKAYSTFEIIQVGMNTKLVYLKKIRTGLKIKRINNLLYKRAYTGLKNCR